MRNLSLGPMALALALLAAPALAQPATPPVQEDPSAAEARAHFDRGRELAEARRFSEAVESFSRSLELVDRPSTVFNLALCHFALERYVEAVEALERFERDADPVEDAQSEADAVRMLAHARGAIATLVVEVEPVDAEVFVDGAAVEGGGTRTVSVNPGPHVVRVTSPYHEPVLLEVEAPPGAEQRRAVTLRSTRRPARLEIELFGRPLATIEVDGRDVGASPASLELDAGPHSVRVVEADAEPVTRDVSLEWNDTVRLLIEEPPPAVSEFDEAAFWGVFGGSLGAVALGVLIGVLVTEVQPSPDGGTTGDVLTVGHRPLGISVP